MGGFADVETLGYRGEREERGEGLMSALRCVNLVRRCCVVRCGGLDPGFYDVRRGRVP